MQMLRLHGMPLSSYDCMLLPSYDYSQKILDFLHCASCDQRYIPHFDYPVDYSMRSGFDLPMHNLELLRHDSEEGNSYPKLFRARDYILSVKE